MLLWEIREDSEMRYQEIPVPQNLWKVLRLWKAPMLEGVSRWSLSAMSKNAKKDGILPMLSSSYSLASKHAKS